MKKIGIVPNIGKKDCYEVLKKFCLILKEKAEVYIATGVLSGHNEPKRAEKINELAREIGVTALKAREFFPMVDVVAVMGGDGTLLCAAPKAAKYEKPIIGINMGRVGFLASADKNYLETVAEKLILGDYKVGEHMMLEATYLK
jgi:NAD+ kinase